MQYVTYAPRCNNCLKPRGGFPGRYTPVKCPRCILAGCCSQACWDAYKPRHSREVCDQYCAMAAQDLFLHAAAFEMGEVDISPEVPEEILPEFTPFRESSWRWYLKFRAFPVRDMNAQHLLVSQDSLSKPLTILHALSKFYSRRELAALPSLTVHVIAAAGWEQIHGSMMALEELLHLLPAAQTLRIALIGPGTQIAAADAGAGAAGARAPWVTMSMGCCPACTERGRRRVITMSSLPYHDFMDALAAGAPATPAAAAAGSAPAAGDAAASALAAVETPAAVTGALPSDDAALRSPDLVIGFNVGFHAERSSFRPSLARIVARGLPFAFTSYTAGEAAADLREVQEAAAGPEAGIAAASDAPAAAAYAVTVVVAPEPNPWASPLVCLDVIEDHPDAPTRRPATAAGRAAAGGGSGSVAAPAAARSAGSGVSSLVIDRFFFRNAFFTAVRGVADDGSRAGGSGTVAADAAT